MSTYLLGVDVGTTSLKVAIIDENAKLIGISSSKYRLIKPEQNWVSIDAESMWKAFVTCVRLLRDGKDIDLGKIAGISISSLCPGLISLGENGEVLADPIIYSDRRSTQEADIILDAVGSEELFAHTANGSMAGAFSGSSMLWIKRHLPEVYEKTTLINEELTGLGIPKGIPVAIGGADTGCATLAAGVTRDGDVCESVGTTDVLTVCVDRPLFDRSFINRCHVVPGTWIYQGAMSFTGAANEWFLNQFYPDVFEKATDIGEAFRMVNEDARQAAPGCDGVVFLPYMLGERSPIWDPYARGVFFGISLQTTRREMNRAVLEGCGYGLRQLAGIAEKVTGNKITKMASIGGGAKSEVWAQMKADITGREIEVLDMSDMAPVGAALLAGVGAGVFRDVYEASEKNEKKIYRVFRPSHENDAVYQTRYETYISLYPALKDIFRANLSGR